MPPRIRADDLAVVVIDVQPFFLEGWMAGGAGGAGALLARLTMLLGLATAYDLPTLLTFEQPVETKGWLPAALEPHVPSAALRLTKQSFDCCREPGIPAAIAAWKRPQLAVAGGETDVCVLQSVLGLIARGYEVFLLEDALFSEEAHVGPAIRRMEHAGAVPTTVKTLFYELRGSVGVPAATERIGERCPGRSMIEPEDLPAWEPRW